MSRYIIVKKSLLSHKRPVMKVCSQEAAKMKMKSKTMSEKMRKAARDKRIPRKQQFNHHSSQPISLIRLAERPIHTLLSHLFLQAPNDPKSPPKIPFSTLTAQTL